MYQPIQTCWIILVPRILRTSDAATAGIFLPLRWVCALDFCEMVTNIASSRITKYFKVNISWSDTSMIWHYKLRSCLIPFSPEFLSGLPCHQINHTGIQHLWYSLLFLFKRHAPLSFQTCASLFIEALAPTIDGTWYEHLLHTTVSDPP